jgi:hypothetical protein
MPTLYRAYGLTISSDLPLPELLPGAGAPDVRVRMAEPRQMLPAAGALISPNEVTLAWTEPGTFIVRGANEVIIHPQAPVDEPMIRLALLGPVLACLLQRRGYLVLHSSAAVVANGAVAFMGESGEGKSTMAAAMHAAGYPVPEPVVFTGFPRLKLTADSLRALGQEPGHGSLLHPQELKRGHRVRASDPDLALPLHRVYLLERSERTQVEPIRGVASMMRLTQHTFGKWMLDDRLRRSQFEQTAELARLGRLRRLTRRSLEYLQEAVEAVARDIAAHAPSDPAPSDPARTGEPVLSGTGGK